MIERGLQKPGKTKGGLATAMGVRPGAVSEILADARLIKATEIQPIIDYLELNSVPIMGRVGAGAIIEPEHEQVPPEGLGEVELPFPISEETIAFEVAGDSMLPKYENGDIIVVFREQRHPVLELLRRRGRGQAEDRRALPENHRAGKIRHPGQPHELQRQADQRGEAGMDRRDLRHPAKGSDRTPADQSRHPGAQRRQGAYRSSPARSEGDKMNTCRLILAQRQAAARNIRPIFCISEFIA